MRTLLLSVLVVFLSSYMLSCGGEESKAPENKQVVQMQAKAEPKKSVSTPVLSKENEHCDVACQKKKLGVKQYWTLQKHLIKKSPFNVKVDRIYFKGACGKGPVPEKRKNTSGIKLVIDGKITNKSKDTLIKASIDGALLVDMNAEHFIELPVKLPVSRKNIFGFPRSVRGVDPWLPGMAREFSVETSSLSEGFCEAHPQHVSFVLMLNSFGIQSATKNWPLYTSELSFGEVTGMAVNEQVFVNNEGYTEPADAHFSIFDELLVTSLDGITRWVDRQETKNEKGLKKGAGTSFPQKISAGDWQIVFKGITSKKELNDYSLDGEDEFLVIVDTELFNMGSEPSAAKNVKLYLEVEPDKWQTPRSVELGAVMRDEQIEANASISGKLVFSRTRFERPFRMKVIIPNAGTLYSDVFSYSIEPLRAAKSK